MRATRQDKRSAASFQTSRSLTRQTFCECCLAADRSVASVLLAARHRAERRAEPCLLAGAAGVLPDYAAPGGRVPLRGAAKPLDVPVGQGVVGATTVAKAGDTVVVVARDDGSAALGNAAVRVLPVVPD